MTSNTAPAPTGPEVPTVADAAGHLATAVEQFAAVERAMCAGVMALSRTIGTGICETIEGLPTDLLLANLGRLIQADAPPSSPPPTCCAPCRSPPGCGPTGSCPGARSATSR